MLDENGSPQIVERAKIVPPRSQVGAITPDQRKQIIDSSVLAGHYEQAIDRESAYEKLQGEQARKRKPLVQRLSQRLNLRLSGRNRRCSRRHWELSPLHFSPLSGRAAAF